MDHRNAGQSFHLFEPNGSAFSKVVEHVCFSLILALCNSRSKVAEASRSEQSWLNNLKEAEQSDESEIKRWTNCGNVTCSH